MNWREHPYLFANGEFRVRDNLNHHDFKPTGFSTKHMGFQEEVNEDGEYGNGYHIIHEPKNCTLIVRKIEDMTDGEIIESLPFACLKDKADPSYIRKMECDKNSYLRSMRLCLYLLSIGVYPFDQSHFETGDVIDIKTLEE